MRKRTRGYRVVALGAALTLMLAGVALANAKSGSFAGSTTQTGDPNGTVHFSVSASHSDVKSFAGGISGNCTKSHHPARLISINLTPTLDMRIHSSQFGFTGKFNITNGPVVYARHVHGNIAGKFVSDRKATGTMKFTWTFDGNAPSGLPGFRCTTGTVQFTAKHT